MTLLHEILDSAVRSDVPLTDLLRRCKLLASRLRQPEVGAWIDLELNGYPKQQPLPDYRIASVNSKGHFSGPFGSGMQNAPIPPSNIEEKLRHFVNRAELREPISSYIELVSSGDHGAFSVPWPADLVKLVASDIYENMVCISAWRELPRGVVAGLLDTVRNRILNFALAIQEEDPKAGESSSTTSPVTPERVAHVFHTHITGSIGNLALGNRDVTQEYSNGVRTGDVESLKEYLRSLGVTDTELRELETALKKDKKNPVTGIGAQVGAWIGTMVVKASSGAFKVGSAVATKLISSAVSRYLGLPE